LEVPALSWFNRQKPDSEQAFMDLVYVHWDALYRYALRLTRDPQQAEDLVQDTLTKAFKAFDRLKDQTNHRAWSFTILRNTFVSRMRKAGREVELEEPQRVEDVDAHRGIAALREQGDDPTYAFEDEVLRALDQLPESQRSALTLCDIEGLSYEEISHIMDCPVGTVRSRIHHARRRLRDTLSGYASARGYDHVAHR
jgi:RNA polymerase sigma-70 factor (ECF subfamily)